MHGYLSQRLDGARDLYLLALALGERDQAKPPPFGPMIQEARIHFENVIVEARMAGLDTHDIQAMLARERDELLDAIRPAIRERLEQLLQHRPNAR